MRGERKKEKKKEATAAKMEKREKADEIWKERQWKERT